MSETQDNNSPNLKVLIVDDEDFITTVIQKIASKLGCEVSSINDARKVGSALVAVNPDVIFLDLLMPDVDGVEVVNMLCEAKCEAKLVLMSGLDERTIKSVSDIATNGGLDVIGTLGKPIQADKIAQLLKPLFNKQQAVHQSDTQQASQRPDRPQPGFHMFLQSEIAIKQPGPDSVPWYRVEPSWILDDGKVVGFESILDSTLLPGIRQGLLSMMVQQLPSALAKAGLDHRRCGIRIPVSGAVLSEKAAPDFLTTLLKQVGISPEGISIQLSENIAASQSEGLLNSVSRLKIKGFKLSTCLHSDLEAVLSGLMKMPLDELLLDLDKARLTGQTLDESETEFQIGSLVSFATKRNMRTTAINVNDARQLAFVQRCGFDKACGTAVK